MANKNAITNGNFESDDVWSYDGSAARVNDGNAMNSTYCCKFPNAAQGGAQQAGQLVSLVAGSSYELTFYAKRSGRMDVWASYVYLNSSGSPVRVHAPSMLNSITGTYSKQTWTFTIPANSMPGVFIYIMAGGNAGDVATAWVDNVELWGEEYIPQLPDPGPHPSGVKHLANGGFEDTSAWTFSGPCGFINDSGNAKEGTRCLRFPYKSSVGAQQAVQYVSASAGKDYILSFYAKRNGRQDVWVCHSYTDADNGFHFFNGPSLLNQMPDNGAYRRMEYRFSIPAGAKNNCTVYIRAGNNLPDTGVVAYVDDVVLVRTDGQGNPELPSNVIGTRTKGFVNTNSSPLRLTTEPGSGTLIVQIPQFADIHYYATTNAAYHYVEYQGQYGYSASQYIMRGTYVNYTGNDPIQKNRAYSQSYRYDPNAILASRYLEILDAWARRIDYEYPSDDGNAGYYPDKDPRTICCAYLPYAARNGVLPDYSIPTTAGNGYNNVPGQKNNVQVLLGNVSSLGGNANLVPGMELFQGTTHMGVYAGTKSFPVSGTQHAVYQSVAGDLGNVESMYNDDNGGPGLTTMNSSQGWPEWGWPKGVILDSAL